MQHSDVVEERPFLPARARKRKESLGSSEGSGNEQRDEAGAVDVRGESRDCGVIVELAQDGASFGEWNSVALSGGLAVAVGVRRAIGAGRLGGRDILVSGAERDTVGGVVVGVPTATSVDEVKESLAGVAVVDAGRLRVTRFGVGCGGLSVVVALEGRCLPVGRVSSGEFGVDAERGAGAAPSRGEVGGASVAPKGCGGFGSGGPSFFLFQINHIIYVYIAFLTPSVIGSLSVFIVSILRWRNLQEQRLLLVQLALADLLASAVLLFITTSNIVAPKYNSTFCLYGLPLVLVFYVLSFMLVNSYALKSKKVLQGWRTRPAESEDVQSGRTREIVLSVLLCSSCILFLHVRTGDRDHHGPETGAPVYYVLFFTVVVVLLSCTVIYNKVFKWQQGQQQQQGFFPVEGDGQSCKRFKHVKHTVRKMVLVIVFCWTPALLLFVLLWTTEQSRLFPLYVIQAATVSLQGFLNSMVYAWKRPNFTGAILGEQTPLITYNHVAFFEESLRTQSV
ncbi:uncharacterized protein [Eucyclogobius newberryi]|uniref:uncharacterized protein n=1 Tax=Eucyclogobius newberryi TaxID=166745 RepID=UPI003B5CA0D1